MVIYCLYYLKIENLNNILGIFLIILSLDNGIKELYFAVIVNGFVNEFVGLFVFFFAVFGMIKNFFGVELVLKV